MKGSSGAGWAAFFFGILSVTMAFRDASHAADVFGVVSIALMAVYFICRSIESLKEEA